MKIVMLSIYFCIWLVPFDFSTISGVGYRISVIFAAMLGLFLFYETCSGYFYVNFVDKRYVWSPAAMSISTQLDYCTFDIFYFGNFSCIISDN